MTSKDGEPLPCTPHVAGGIDSNRLPNVTYFNVQLVRPAGVEPATSGFEVRRSIQLSYGRKQIADCRLRIAGTDSLKDPQSEIRNPQKKNWGERRGLNPRPPGPQPGALPTELRPP